MSELKPGDVALMPWRLKHYGNHSNIRNSDGEFIATVYHHDAAEVIVEAIASWKTRAEGATVDDNTLMCILSAIADVTTPEETLNWYRRFMSPKNGMKAWGDMEHGDDCTGQPASCCKCIYEARQKQVAGFRLLLAEAGLLPPPPAKEAS